MLLSQMTNEECKAKIQQWGAEAQKRRDQEKAEWQEFIESIKEVQFYKATPAQVKKERNKMTAELRRLIIEKDNYTCRMCGHHDTTGMSLEVDHIIPVSKGGKTVITNLQTLCRRCNKQKSDKISLKKA